MPSVGQEFVRVVTANFKAVKSYADKTIEQLAENELYSSAGNESNSIAVIIQHITGNLISRFTDFYSSDGEKPNRNRDVEFEDQHKSKQLLLKNWNEAWEILFSLLNNIREEDLLRIVYIRNEPHTVIEALNRQLYHYSFHAGQIVVLGKQLKGADWKNLSIPKKKN